MSGRINHGRCTHCGLNPTPEDHDGCIGTLPEKEVMNACCGHGIVDHAYVQFWDLSRIAGSEASEYILRNRPDGEVRS